MASDTKPRRAPKTIKEKQFAKEYVANGGNGTKAALKVYNVKDDNSARALAAETLAKLNIVDMMENVQGLTQADRLKCLAEGLYSTKNISGIGDARANTVDFVEVPDMPTRYKYLELTFKLDGSLKQAETVNNIQNNLTVSPILGPTEVHSDVHGD